MHSRFRSGSVLTLLWASALLAATLAAQEPAASSRPDWTHDAMERFLREAEIVRTSGLSQGVTISVRATLSDGNVTHDAHIQDIDESKPAHPTSSGWELNFRDSYKYNVAAYRLDRMLGLGMTPVSVQRSVQGKQSAVTWWVDDILMTERTRYLKKLQPPDITRWNYQMHCVRVFDELIYNTDRNLGNLVISAGWRIWMIDHTRAFRIYERLRKPKNLLKCDRVLLERLRALDAKQVETELKPYLENNEIRALLTRRDMIVKHFERQAASRGESAVLFRFLNDR